MNLWMGVAAALVTLWATFAPCFLWVFAGAPYIEWLGSRPRLNAALEAISAAVVGVILNLSLWFALHVMFDTVTKQAIGPLTLWIPQFDSLVWVSVAISLIAAGLLLIARRSILETLTACAALGYVGQALI